MMANDGGALRMFTPHQVLRNLPDRGGSPNAARMSLTALAAELVPCAPIQGPGRGNASSSPVPQDLPGEWALRPARPPVVTDD